MFKMKRNGAYTPFQGCWRIWILLLCSHLGKGKKRKMSSALTVFTHYISCLRFNVKVLQRENVLNCKKRRGRRKEKWDTGRGVLPPRPAIGSSLGNTKAFSEWICSPKHSHKRTHSNIVNKTENLAVLSPCVLQKERYQFECQQLTVVLPVMRLVLKSICRLQSPKKKKRKRKGKEQTVCVT